jgi:membrane protein required for colicin V production
MARFLLLPESCYMSFIDIFFLIVMTGFILLGVWKGFFREVLGLLGVLLGIFIAIAGFGPLSKILHQLIPKVPVVVWIVISFVIIFVGVYLASRLLAMVLGKLSSLIMLGWLNRLLGGVIGAVKGAFIISLILLVLGFFPFQDSLKNIRKHSIFYKPFQRIIPMIYNVITDFSFSSHKLEKKFVSLLGNLQGQLNEKVTEYFLYKDE